MRQKTYKFLKKNLETISQNIYFTTAVEQSVH